MSIRINGQVIASATDITDYSKKTGDETLSGVKTFSSSPIIPTPAYTDNSTNAANTEWIRNNIAPAGSVMIWAGTTVPTGYLLCDGSEVSRTTYSDLFSAIGTTYGVGDGSSTFNLPNFQDRVIQGCGTRGVVGTYKAESLPNISGKVSVGSQTGIISTVSDQSEGVFYADEDRSYCPSPNQQATGKVLGLNASRSSSVYQDDAPVQQEALLIQCCIKY